MPSIGLDCAALKNEELNEELHKKITYNIICIFIIFLKAYLRLLSVIEIKNAFFCNKLVDQAHNIDAINQRLNKIKIYTY
jgi:hypothetical protein